LGNLFGQREKKTATVGTGATTTIWTITVPNNSAFEVEVQVASTLATSNTYGFETYGSIRVAVARGPSFSGATSVDTTSKLLTPATGAGHISDITATVVGTDVEIAVVVAAHSPTYNNTYDTHIQLRSLTPRTKSITVV
jgi:hypothetical protein